MERLVAAATRMVTETNREPPAFAVAPDVWYALHAEMLLPWAERGDLDEDPPRIPSPIELRGMLVYVAEGAAPGTILPLTHRPR
jgi:hypothetical protein